MSHEDSPVRTPATDAGIQGEIDRLQSRVKELQSVQASGRRIMSVLVIVVVVEFAAFAIFTRQRVTANFNQQAVQQAVAERVPQVTPELRSRMIAVAQDTMPVYRQLLMQRFETVGPDVARDAVDRLQKLPLENGKELNDQLHQAFDSALTKLQPELRRMYPKLSDATRDRILQQRFTARIAARDAAVAQRITEISNQQVASIRDVLQRFDVPAESSLQSRNVREREFLHALVDVIMDGQVMSNLAPATADARAYAAPAAKTVSVVANDKAAESDTAKTAEH